MNRKIESLGVLLGAHGLAFFPHKQGGMLDFFGFFFSLVSSSFSFCLAKNGVYDSGLNEGFLR